MKPLVIAIDGPSGAGKGTVARAVAAASSATVTSTAARCTAPSAGRRCATAWRSTTKPRSPRLPPRRAIDITSTHVTIDGDDVTRAIRTPEIDRAAAGVARLPRVRSVLVERQRQMGAERRHRDGRARHRHRRVSRCRREALPGCVAGRAGAPPRQRSRRTPACPPRSPKWRRCSRSATRSTARARSRRSTPPSDAHGRGHDREERRRGRVSEVMALDQKRSQALAASEPQS